MNNKLFIALPTLRGAELILTDEVNYVCSDGRNCIFHLEDKTEKIITIQVGKIEEVLVGSSFLRIHQQYIVNINKIKEIYTGSKAVILISGEKLPISRSYKENFRRRMSGFCYKILNGL
jgi:two-component system, LytTR family, response regulator